MSHNYKHIHLYFCDICGIIIDMTRLQNDNERTEKSTEDICDLLHSLKIENVNNVSQYTTACVYFTIVISMVIGE